MPTSLARFDARPVTRETAYRSRGRPVIITLREGGLLIDLREKGRRSRVTLTIGEAWIKACWNAAAQLKREKAERRKLRRAAKYA